MMYLVVFASCLVLVSGGTAADSTKDQFCTDPRTMKKHKAYTEWADAYSCTRHRCQPGGRNLAIYTVGCKRVEAPESAIECEEVVEDTNMQFPYCCTRLRCLVVVRGEVWTRVLGQPWETLPAAPWSHMYKMKKPPPVDGTFLPKEADMTGPVYELAEPEGHDKMLRATKKDGKDCADCVMPMQRSASAPDIVIALSTGAESKTPSDALNLRHGTRKENRVEEDIGEQHEQRNEIDAEEAPVITEKVPEIASEEKMYNMFPPTKAPRGSHRSQFEHSWTDSPREQPWPHERVKMPEAEALKADTPMPSERPEEKTEEPPNLQALVDAIGSRMRDIESVVQKMSSKGSQPPPVSEDSSSENPRRDVTDNIKEGLSDSDLLTNPKKSNPNSDKYRRFSNKHSKYVHGSGDITTEPPLFVEDAHLSGYFSDPSNNMLRRSGPKEPVATYMAPVNTDTRRSHSAPESIETKHKKHSHRRKKSRGHHKHHQKEEKKRFNKVVNSIETDRNTVSLEDSGNNTN